MPNIKITTKLPGRLIADLELAGAKILKESEIPVIILVDSKKATELYMAFLAGEEEVDLALLVTFGGLMAPYQSLAVQLEVHSMLATFQPLLAAHFAPGAAPFPLLPAPAMPPLGGYHYHQQISIQMVQQEIEDPSPLFAAHVPLLTGLVSGSVIADLQITYSNCIVVRRLRKI